MYMQFASDTVGRSQQKPRCASTQEFPNGCVARSDPSTVDGHATCPVKQAESRCAVAETAHLDSGSTAVSGSSASTTDTKAAGAASPARHRFPTRWHPRRRQWSMPRLRSRGPRSRHRSSSPSNEMSSPAVAQNLLLQRNVTAADGSATRHHRSCNSDMDGTAARQINMTVGCRPQRTLVSDGCLRG